MKKSYKRKNDRIKSSNSIELLKPFSVMKILDAEWFLIFKLSYLLIREGV